MASLQATRESEDPPHDLEGHHEDHVGLTTEASEYDVNRNLDMRRASFHPNRADILPPNADEKPSILGKLMGVFCAEGGTPAAGDKVEASAAAGPEAASDSHPAFENLSNKLRDKGERVHLLGEKGVRTHSDSASPEEEDTADSAKGDSETGLQNLKGELGEVEVEDSGSPPSGPVQCHTVVDSIPGYVADVGSSLEEPEFADASSTFQQSSEGVGSYTGPRVGDEARVEEKEKLVNLEEGKDSGEDALPLGLHESGLNGEEFADAPSAFQQTYDKTIESTGAETEAQPDAEGEKATVWSKNSSTKQDEGRPGLERDSSSSSSALTSSDEVEDLAKVPVSRAPREIDLTQQESDKGLGELPRGEVAVDMEGIKADAPSAVPQFYDESSEGAEAEGESHPGIKEEADSAVDKDADVEDEAKPGFFSRVKQTLWSNSRSSTQELESESSSSSSSSLEEVSSATQEEDLPPPKDFEGISAPLAERVLFPSDDSEENDGKYPDTVTEKEELDLSQALDEKLALQEETPEQGDDEDVSGQDEETSTETDKSPSFFGSIGKKIGLSGSKSSSDGSQAVVEKPTLKDETREQGDAKEAPSDENLSEQDEKTPSETEKPSSFLGTIGKKIGLSSSKSMSEVDKRPGEQEQKSPSEQQESSGLFSNIASKIGFSGSARSAEEEVD